VTHEFDGRQHHKRRTWTTRRITVIILIAVVYGVWFNFIDSLNYCYKVQDNNNQKTCVSVGQMFGGDPKYQPWNIVGHMIPGLFLLLYFMSKKEELAIIELFLAGILISTAIMDSPLWGATRLLLTGNPLWYCDPCEPPHPINQTTTGPPIVQLMTWIAYYYNPVGTYVVFDTFPTAALIFWSVVGRIAGAVTLIVWQYRQEKKEAPISTLKELVFRPVSSNPKRK
jgi:hypothetical protein